MKFHTGLFVACALALVGCASSTSTATNTGGSPGPSGRVDEGTTAVGVSAGLAACTGAGDSSAHTVPLSGPPPGPTGGTVYSVDWLVLGSGDHLNLIDVVIDGVSTMSTTKQDYASVLRSTNGNLDGLTSRLAEKVH